MNVRIKKVSLALMVLLFSATTLQAQHAAKWELDKAHTTVNFGINHFFSEVKGSFTDFDGEFHFDKEQLGQSQINFTIQVESINTQNKKRDEHLLSNDFFNAEDFSEIKFASTSIEQTETGYLAHGKLTLRDVTKHVAIPFTITGQIEHPMMEGVQILGLQFDTTIKRTDYGVGTGKWAMTKIVGDEVRISIPMELNQKPKM